MLTSLQNSKIKDLVRLREKKSRQKSGLAIAEGTREIKCLLESGVEVTEVFFCEEFLNEDVDQKSARKLFLIFEKHRTPLTEVSKSVYEKISYGERCEGIIVVFRMKNLSLDDLKQINLKNVLVIENVEKPGNLGAILRTCDAGGINAVLVCDQQTDIFNPNVIRASLGAVFLLPIVSCTNQQALDFLRANHIQIVATKPNAQVVYSDVNFKKPSAVVIGREQDGLTSFWLKNADVNCFLPMNGKIDSLNASTSAAILIYEMNRQKEK